MILNDDYADLLSVIQTAAIDPDKWDIAIQRLVTLMNGSGAHFITLDKYDGSLIAQRTVNFDTFVAKDYAAHYHEISPRTKFLMEYEGHVCFDEMFIDADQMKKDEFYNWTSSFDAQYFIGAHSLGDLDTFSGIGIFRDHKSGHVQKGEISFLENVWPHLKSALSTSRKLSGSTLHFSQLVDTLESLGKAALILRNDNEIVELNTMAENCLHDNPLMTIESGKLAVNPLQNRNKFNNAIASTLKRSAGLIFSNFSDEISLYSDNYKASFKITLQPLRATDVFMGRQIPCTLILISNLAEDIEIQKIKLAKLFQLTNAESDVAVALYRGASLNEISLSRKSSIHTVRNQLKVIFDKMSVISQAQLVAYIAQLLKD